MFAITLEAIDRAEQATMKSATRYLETHMGGDLAAVTDGRYRRVRVDDKTLDIEVHAPEKDDWVPVRSLSQGTLDLVYLVARLGLVRLVTGDRRPPLIFDDPFVTLDDARAARALTLLKGIASDFQVIYMTTSSRYDEAADAVVVLEGPVSVDRGRDRGRRRAPARSAPTRADRGPGTDRTARLIELGGAQTATIVLGLLSAVAWGAGDFGGGLLTRRTALFSVVLVSQTGRHGAGVRTERAAPARPRRSRWTCSGASCAGWSAGSASRRSTTASPSGGWGSWRRSPGVIAALIPVVAGIVLEGVPSTLTLVGIALAIVAVVLVSRVSDESSGPSGLRFALVAGVGIGLFSVFVAQISDGHAFGPLAVIRLVEVVVLGIVVIVTGAAWRTGTPVPARDGRRRRPRHGRQRRLHPGRPGWGAGGGRRPVVALPGDDGDPRRGLPARTGHPDARGRDRARGRRDRVHRGRDGVAPGPSSGRAPPDR